MSLQQKATKKELIEEIIHCGKDPVFFINTYAKIQHPEKGLIPFKTYPFQDDIIHGYLKNRFNIILKARQLGVTTISAGYIAWYILFQRDKNVLIVATKRETAQTMIRMIKNIFKYLPKWLLDIGRITTNNKTSLELSNGSRVKAVPLTADVGRSEAVSLLMVDEVAHIPNFEEIWTGLWPTLSRGGSAALMSTPNGTANFFHKQFIQARDGINNFNCKFGTYVNPKNPLEVYNDRFMWWVCPDYDDTWFAAQTAGKSPRDIAQEYLCNFLASGDTFVDNDTLTNLERTVLPPSEIFPSNRDVWMWEKPRMNGFYLISCDVSRGDATDYSGFHVLRLDVNPLVQVAEYKGKIKPDHLGSLLYEVAQYYGNAIIAPENNSGWSAPTINKLQELGYANIYYSKRRSTGFKRNQLVDPYYAQQRVDYLPGYSITTANRIEMLAKMEQYVRLREIVINSPRLLDEFKTFIVNMNNKPEAQRGMSDDLVMALAGGLWVRDEAYLYSYRSDSYAEAMLGGMSVSNKNTTHYNDFNFDTHGFSDRGRIKEHLSQQNKIVMGNGAIEDLSWLLPSKK
jgi:hypothetical protein